MQVIPFKPRRVRDDIGARKGGVVLLLAATLAAGSASVLADQVEREDETPVPAPAPALPPRSAVPPAPPAPEARPAAKTQNERDRDAKLQEAQRRLEAAAADVAALSSEIASQAMENFGSMWNGGERRSIIGVQIEAADSGTGAKVREVSPGGAAETAGIHVGDTIVAVNGTPIK
jgi:C-terminal processing protease CtpA/Prc